MSALLVKQPYEDKHDDAYRTISEVADELGLPQHVLRFWETRFSQIRPMKRGGGRRFYRKDDVDLIKAIKLYLYSEGLTIRGLQKIIKEQGMPHILSVGRGEIALASGVAASPKQATHTARILQENLVKHIEFQQSQEAEEPLHYPKETPKMSDYQPKQSDNSSAMKFRPMDDEPEVLPAFMRSVSAPKIEPVIAPVVNRFQARLNQHSGEAAMAVKVEPVISKPKPLSAEKSSRLQAAYYELSECKRLLEGVLR